MDFERHKAYLELLNEADNMVNAFIDENNDELAYHYARKVKYAFMSNDMESTLGKPFEDLCPNCISAISTIEEDSGDDSDDEENPRDSWGDRSLS